MTSPTQVMEAPQEPKLDAPAGDMDIRRDSSALLSFITSEYLLSTALLAMLAAQLVFDFDDPRWWTVHYWLFVPTLILLGATLDVFFLGPPIVRWLLGLEERWAARGMPLTPKVDIELAELKPLPTVPPADSSSASRTVPRFSRPVSESTQCRLGRSSRRITGLDL